MTLFDVDADSVGIGISGVMFDIVTGSVSDSMRCGILGDVPDSLPACACLNLDA